MSMKSESTENRRLRGLIQETSSAYELYHKAGYVNSDFAEFASMSIADFKAALRDPNLTRRQLRQLLRHGNSAHRDMAPKSCWASFLANYIASTANGNLQKS